MLTSYGPLIEWVPLMEWVDLLWNMLSLENHWCHSCTDQWYSIKLPDIDQFLLAFRSFFDVFALCKWGLRCDHASTHFPGSRNHFISSSILSQGLFLTNSTSVNAATPLGCALHPVMQREPSWMPPQHTEIVFPYFKVRGEDMHMCKLCIYKTDQYVGKGHNPDTISHPILHKYLTLNL